MTRISVITVAYNNAETIAETIASVRGQSYAHLEHIIVDGGSQDGTLEIVATQKCANSIVLSEPDHGIYDAMNKGISLSSGDIIGFLNADDLYADREVVADIVHQFEDRQLEAIFGDLIYFRTEQPGQIIRRYCSRDFAPHRLSSGWMPAHPTLYMRRSIYDAVGALKIDYRIGADFEFCARVFGKRQTRYRYIDRVMVKMRAGGISTRGLRSTLVINKEIVRALKENGLPVSWAGIAGKYLVKSFQILRRG